jgi:hypothetical protein
MYWLTVLETRKSSIKVLPSGEGLLAALYVVARERAKREREREKPLLQWHESQSKGNSLHGLIPS